MATAHHTVALVPVEQDLLGIHEALGANKPDVVLNLCESLAADARGEMLVPAMLELLRVPNTGSSAFSLALALHKNKAKEILRARSVPTPDFCVVERAEELTAVELPFPLIVKPSREDASVGIDFDSVVTTRSGLVRAGTKVLRTFRQPALVERYIEGREVYVPLLGNWGRRALPLSEIRFGSAFTGRPNIVSYKAKWDSQSAECIESPSEPPRSRPTSGALRARAMDAFEASVPRLRARRLAHRRLRPALRHRYQPQLRPPPAGRVRQSRGGRRPLLR